jgi:hypothetical protein
VRSKILILLAPIVLLAGCSSAEEESSFEKAEVANEAAAEATTAKAPMAERTAAATSSTDEVPPPALQNKVAVPNPPVGKTVEDDTLKGTARMPEFQYSHRYDFESERKSLGEMQDKHVAACEAMGAKICKVANFTQDLDGSFGAAGSLEIYVATDQVNGLVSKFSEIARSLGGERTKTEMLGSDVTAQADDARLQLRNALEEKARLEAILKSGAATTAEKRAAASALAELNPQLNGDKLTLDQVASDIDYTKVEISYSSGVPLMIWLGLLALAGLIGFGAFTVHRRTESLARPQTATAGA